MSCVIVIAVTPSSTTISLINSFITLDIMGSSPVVGSSKNIISGSVAIARAKLTLFCIPPDNSAGYLSAISGPKPTRRNFFIEISRASSFGRFWLPRCNRNAMFFHTGNESNNAPPWNSIPKRSRN